jgi:hypothetical protein
MEVIELDNIVLDRFYCIDNTTGRVYMTISRE